MISRHFIRFWCVAVLCAAVVAASSAPPVLSSDVNGDRRVDVRDIQRIIAGVLTPESGAAGDVNGDGRIDVLDLHQALCHASRPPGPGDRLPEDPAPDGCCFSYQSVWAAAVEARLDETFADTTAAALPRVSHADRTPMPAKTGRYLLQLTPNAPPHA